MLVENRSALTSAADQAPPSASAPVRRDPGETAATSRRGTPSTLLRDRDFRRFWSGQTISVVGAQITAFTIPLFAVTQLGADASDVALLRVLETIPFVVLALPVGVWLDRHAPRPAMMVANLGRAGLVVVTAVAGLLGLLQVGTLAVALLLVGAATVVFDIAYLSYLPRLVPPGQLVDGNSKLSLSDSAAQVGGPGLSGLLVQTITAPAALLVTGLTYAMSALSLHRLRHRDVPSNTRLGGDSPTAEPIDAPGGRRGLAFAGRQIREGLRLVTTERYLRVICLEAFTFNLFVQFGETLVVVYALNDLHLSAAALGLFISLGSVGAVLGAALAPHAVRAVGFGPAFTAGTAVGCAAPLLVPLAGTAPQFAGPLIAMSHFLAGAGVAISVIGSVTLRQSVTPPRLLARVNAVMRLASYSALPIGSAAAGVLSEATTVRTGLFIGAAGLALPVLILLLSPIPRLRDSFDAGSTPHT
ncbi:MFS transporter [Micromonospora sp. NPDC023966]|uniref:MFS transporter n=1 Tax=Micromonospora sp. NPDC023966 TaxID=3154699 RepID=UPI0034011996